MYDNHRRSSAILGSSPDVVSGLEVDIDLAPQDGKRQQEQVDHEEEASSRVLWRTLTLGSTPDIPDSRVYRRDIAIMEEPCYFMGCNGYSWPNALDTQQGDEMFNLFINVDV